MSKLIDDIEQELKRVQIKYLETRTNGMYRDIVNVTDTEILGLKAAVEDLIHDLDPTDDLDILLATYKDYYRKLLKSLYMIIDEADDIDDDVLPFN